MHTAEEVPSFVVAIPIFFDESYHTSLSENGTLIILPVVLENAVLPSSSSKF